jgi:putative membrane protein
VPSVVALLHTTDRIDWLRWTVHPSTVIGILALGALYTWRLRAADRAGDAPTLGQRLAFASGLVALFVALNGPIHDLSDSYLFSAHMVQHLLLTMLVTPLLIVGTSGGMLRPILARRAPLAIARRITTGAAAFIIFNVTLIAWHLPPLYNLAMADHGVHIVQHLCFLATSVLMWWPLLSRIPELPALSRPLQLLYICLLMIPMSVVGMIITYADEVLYPAYESAPRISGLSPQQDQLVGGLIMWIPGSLIYIAMLTVVFFKWAREAEAEELGSGAMGQGPGEGKAALLRSDRLIR